MSNICWICGKIATTGEHSQKKTDVQAMFGKGSYKGKGVIKYDFGSNRKNTVQGPDSKPLKYSKDLCEECNTKTTKPHDMSYEKLSNYIKNNIALLYKVREINMNIVFGKKLARREQQNIYRYFIKAFGSQLNDVGLEVPKKLKEAILCKNWDNDFRVTISVAETYEEYLHNYPLEGEINSNGDPVGFHWAQHIGWGSTIYAYRRDIPKEYGEEWFGKTRRIRVGRI